MAKLIYTAIASLDGFVADDAGKFEWAEPDEEVFRFVNELERPIGTYLYGRRMFETMASWETLDADTPVKRDFAKIWRTAEKIVFSRTLGSVATTRTRIESALDVDAIRKLKASSAQDLTVGGAELAGQIVAAGLVDELNLFACPIVVGSGKRWLSGKLRVPLALVSERRFGNGVVHTCYRVSVSGGEPCA